MFKQTLPLLIVAAVLLAGCSGLPYLTTIAGSGQLVTQKFDFTGFDSLQISSAFQVEVVASDRYTVEVTVDDNLVDSLQVEQRGKTVAIGLEPTTGIRNPTLRARVTMPSLVDLRASGSARVELTGFKSSENVTINVSGASTVQGDLELGDLDAEVAGASKLVLTGSGDSLRADASGASTADLSDFAVGDANVEASGASHINVNASGTLDAKASGASGIRYTGDPTLGRIDESGAGTVSGQ